MIPEARNDAEADAQEVGRLASESLCTAVNRHDKHQIACGLALGLLRSHRTLQQSAVSALAEALVAYAKESKDFTDIRNEHVVKTLLKHEAALREIAQAPFI